MGLYVAYIFWFIIGGNDVLQKLSGVAIDCIFIATSYSFSLLVKHCLLLKECVSSHNIKQYNL